MKNWRISVGRPVVAALLLVPVAWATAPLAPSGAATCEATTFNGFSPADDSRLQRNGVADYTLDNRLRVTASSGGAGSTFTKSPITLAGDASFSTAFSFEFTDPQGGGADGLVFVVQTLSNSVGSSGGGIGYEGITNSVGVEFDNWDNGSSDENNSSHVGIDVNGNIDSVVQTPVGPDLDAGGVRFAWVDYDGTTDTFEVRYATTSERPAAATLTQTLDLPTILGATDAFLGFTSATGAATANHDVVTWSFTTCFAPLGQSTPPTVSAGPDQNVGEDTAAALDGTVTDADPEETVTTLWTVTAGAPCTFANAAAVDTTVTCTEPGTYTLTLTADDGVNGAVSDQAVLTVTAAPVAPDPPAGFQPIGYRMVAFDGGVFTFGERAFHGSLGDRPLNKPVVGGADDPATFEGYWLVATDGGVFTFGSAGFFGSLGSEVLTSPIVEIEPTPSGMGYWLVSAAGKVYPFGDAKHFGDMISQALNKPVIGMAATSTGLGYWLVAEDGGIFAFGDAKFMGSMGSTVLNAPIDDIAPLGNDAGYYLVAGDGGVFSFGAAAFHGSTGSMKLNQPVIAMLAHPDGSGYWLAARDGGVFTFGALPFFGSMGSVRLTAPINDLIH